MITMIIVKNVSGKLAQPPANRTKTHQTNGNYSFNDEHNLNTYDPHCFIAIKIKLDYKVGRINKRLTLRGIPSDICSISSCIALS